MAGDFVAPRVQAIEAEGGRHVGLDLALVDVSGRSDARATPLPCCLSNRNLMPLVCGWGLM